MEEAVKIESGIANDGRRFSLVIERVTKTLSGDKTIISGDLHGTMKKGDHVYIIAPGKYVEADVSSLETVVEGKYESPDEASDCSINLSLTVENDELLKQFGVISSVHPLEKFDPKKPMENPYLSALLWVAPKYQKEKLYIGLLSAVLAHTVFVTPMKMDAAEEEGKKKFGFYMLPAKKPEEGETPKEFLFPVFTDFEEMSKWKAVNKPGAKVPATPLNFKQVIDLTKPEVVKGFIVNPFSKNMMIAGEGLINAIVNSEGYKRDFGPKPEEAQA